MAIVTYTEPLLAVFLVVALVALLRMRRERRPLLALIAVLGIAVLTWPPADWLISRPLESRYPVRPFHADRAPDAIVVLSAAVNPPTFELPYPRLGIETYDRCEMALWLHRQPQLQSVPILTCGGKENPKASPYSVSMRDYLVRSGIPSDSIWTEERSDSTHENAAFGAEILRQHGVRRIVLVVDSQSMLRAEACFRKEGFEVTPAPSTFRELGPLSRELLPSWKALRRNEAALHEGLGLVWYRLHGWI